MERTTTARIDMHKLQILNDRITMCLDALHQLRFSVHNIGAAHVPGVQYGLGQTVNPFGYPTYSPVYGAGAFNGMQAGYGVNAGYGMGAGYGVGAGYGIGYSPVAQPFFGQGLNNLSPVFGGIGQNYGVYGTPVNAWGTPAVDFGARGAYANGACAFTAPTATSQIW